MTGFIEVNSGGVKTLVNVACIRYITPHEDDNPNTPAQSIIRFDGHRDAKVLLIDHPYAEVIQMLLKTDCAAVAR
jgi:hypothetical protein